MKAFIPISLLIFLCTNTYANFNSETVVPIDSGKAKIFLKESDEFSRSLSDLDRAARLLTPESTTEESYLEYVSSQALDWTEDEKRNLALSIDILSKAIQALGLNFQLPNEVLFIKTTGTDEFDTCYTRRNVVICSAKNVGKPLKEFAPYVFHELFHISSRYMNIDLKDRLYGLVGFHRFFWSHEYPSEFKPQKIINPDAINYDHYISVTLKENGDIIPVIPTISLTTKREDIGVSFKFFNHLSVRLLRLAENSNGFAPYKDQSGGPIFYELKDTDYLRKTSRNTDYIIHPEEIIADNFMILIQKQWFNEIGENLEIINPDDNLLNELRSVFSKASK